MNATSWPRGDVLAERLLWIDPTADAFGDATVQDMRALPREGDLLVVNDAATLPASLCGHTEDGAPIEVRLASRERGSWLCIVFGAGDFHTRTEDRAPAPTLRAGSVIRFGDALNARVDQVVSSRQIVVQFDRDGDALWASLYGLGRPIQYAHVKAALPLFHVQTGYASRPWAAEMPSAGRPLAWSLLLALKARGVHLARVTHAAGLSSTGDETLDATLPWPERFDIPEDTVRAVAATKRSGGRIIAVGTSVVRALEGSACQHSGRLTVGEGTTSLLLGPGATLHVVDGLLTGIHERSATHFALLRAFAELPLLEEAYGHAERSDYQGHEFGDSCLILGGVSLQARTRSRP